MSDTVELSAAEFAARAINFALTQPQAQRIHRALLLLESTLANPHSEAGALLFLVDAASKEMETRP
jgi:hypothetical protein